MNPNLKKYCACGMLAVTLYAGIPLCKPCLSLAKDNPDIPYIDYSRTVLLAPGSLDLSGISRTTSTVGIESSPFLNFP